MEFSYAEKLELPPDQEKLLHIISNKELKQQIHDGHFATLESCREGALEDLAPAGYFKQHTKPNDCDMFWEPKGKTASAGKR